MASSLLGLAPGGGYLAIHITADAGGLLHHLFTITPHSCEMSWLFVSVALIRQVSSSRRVPRPGCYPTPCSMECGLSSTPTTQGRDRPTDLRPHYHTRKGTYRQQESGRFKQDSYHSRARITASLLKNNFPSHLHPPQVRCCAEGALPNEAILRSSSQTNSMRDTCTWCSQ
jgi:hypothetical protein